MNRHFLHLSLAAAAWFFFASVAMCQIPAYAEAGPVPPAIASAKTIFVSNAGSDAGLFPEPFSGDEGRGYTEFYAALKATGGYTLVADPSQADLVLELRLTAPYIPSDTNKPVNKVNGAANPLPQFKLVVYDRKTHYVLWAITQPIEMAFLQKTHDRNFDEALQALLNQFLALAHRPAGTATPAPTPLPTH